MSSQFLSYVAPGLTLIYASSYLIGELSLLVYGSMARKWPTTLGTILQAELRPGPPQVAGYQLGRAGPLINMTLGRRYPAVIYRYSVGDAEYHGSHLGYRADWRSRERWSLPWKAGDRVRVHYDPNHPAHAVLRAGVGAENWVGAALGVVGVALSIYWLTFVVRAA